MASRTLPENSRFSADPRLLAALHFQLRPDHRPCFPLPKFRRAGPARGSGAAQTSPFATTQPERNLDKLQRRSLLGSNCAQQTSRGRRTVVAIFTNAMPIDPKQLARWDQMGTELESFLQACMPTTEEEADFLLVVTAIAGDAIPNYWMLRDAYSKDQQGRVAWACRNLLELAVFAEFVVESATNAKEFAEDRLIDGHQIALLLRNLEDWEKVDETVSHVVPIVQGYVQQMKAEHITRTQFRRVENIAKEDLKKEFSTVNRLCSKFVHPTAWSLLTAHQGPDRFPQASEILFVYGANYFMTVCAAFMPHIRQYGLRPKPPHQQSQPGIA